MHKNARANPRTAHAPERSGVDWGALPFVLALAEKGSLVTAARLLGVNHTTVLRRIRAVEEQLGTQLFERRTTGHILSPAGEKLVASARQMQELFVDAERRIAGEDLRLEGTIRLTTTDTLALTILPGILRAFSAEHSAVRIDMTTTNTMLSLARRDAEVAVRPSKNAAPSYVGRRVSELAMAIYATPRYFDRVPARVELAKHVWLGLDESLAQTTIAKWMARALPSDVTIAMRFDSVMALAHGAASGAGVAALPCYVGDTMPALQRVRAGTIDELATELWILTHEDLRRTARVRAITDALALGLAKERELLEGRRPTRGRATSS